MAGLAPPAAPIWIVPSTPGQLSNFRGSNQTTDKIPFTIRYSNPRATADAPGTMRMYAYRQGVGGGPSQMMWDSWWFGSAGTQQPLPSAMSVHGSTCVVQWNSRVYMAQATTGYIFSAPFNGSSIGTWRQENTSGLDPSASSQIPSLPTICSMVAVGGFLYALPMANPVGGVYPVMYAPFNADGTLGRWTYLAAGTGYPIANADGMIAGYTDNSGVSYLTVINTGVAGGGGTPAGCTLNPDGSVSTAGWVAGAGANTFGGAMGAFFYAAPVGDGTQAVLNIVGGGLAGAAVATTGYSTSTKGVPGTWNAGTSLPAARSQFAFPRHSGYAFYVVGGVDATNAAQTTVYFGSSNVTGAWTTSTHPLGVAAKDIGGVGSVANTRPVGQMSGGVNNGPAVVIMGNASTTVQFNFLGLGGTGELSSAWSANASTAMAVGNLGTGGAIVNNLDGTVDVTVLYQAVVQLISIVGGFTDGDLVTLFVQFTDSNGGDPSPVSSTIIKIGQQPTASPLALATGADTEPLVTFNYNAGVGGGPEAAWQVRIYKHSDSVVLVDSGIVNGSGNSYKAVPIPTLPYIAIGYDVEVRVWSTDVPMPGSTNASGPYWLTSRIFGVSNPVLPEPTAVTATPDNVNGLMVIQWTNPATTGSVTAWNRIYYRVAGTTQWFLARDNVPAVVGFTQSVQLMDIIGFKTNYEFGVSAMSSLHQETFVVGQSDGFETLGSIASSFVSLGTDAKGTLASWVQDSGVWSIAANVASCSAVAGAEMHAGHPDWTDGDWRIRFQMPATANAHPSLKIHVSPGNGIQGRVNGSICVIDKFVNNAFTSTLASAACTLVAGNWYWLWLSASGTSYTLNVIADNAGAMSGATVGTVGPVSIYEQVLQSGYISLRSGNAASIINWGGAFATVCQSRTYLPLGWTPAGMGTTSEPAFCASKINPHTGTFSASIYAAVAADYGYWQNNTTQTFINVPYTITYWYRGPGENIYVSDPNNDQANFPAAAAWTKRSFSFTPTGTFLVTLRDGPGGGSVVPGTHYWDDIYWEKTPIVASPISPDIHYDLGGFMAMLHVVGSGPTQNAPLYLVGTPKVAKKVDVSTTLMFGSNAPLARYGVGIYRVLQIKPSGDFAPGSTLANAAAKLDAVINQAILGKVLCYRDLSGMLVYCAVDPDQARDYDLYTSDDLKLTEIAYTYTP